MKPYTKRLSRIIRCCHRDVIDEEMILTYIMKHAQLQAGYMRLENEYEANPPILYQQDKTAGKPDNRLVIAHGHYLVDMFDGFFIGKPVQISSSDDDIAERIDIFNKLNAIDDENAELSKIASVYGHAIELMYQDEEAVTRVTHIKPTEAFIVYDDHPNPHKKFGVHIINDGETYDVYTPDLITTYVKDDEGRLRVLENMTMNPRPNLFGEVPMIEYVQNEERMGLFEPALTMIDHFNKAISEKANDVDYFADAYIKVIGVKMNPEIEAKLRDARIINMYGRELEKAEVGFMDKPSADETQENLLDRLDKKIFQICNVADLTDENFGNATGIAKEMKLQGMSNQAKMKERKFQRAMAERYRLFFSIPLNGQPNDWLDLRYSWSRNLPQDIEKEASVAKTLKGIVSDETLLNYLSIVDNPKEELDRLLHDQETVLTDDIFSRLRGDAVDETTALSDQ